MVVAGGFSCSPELTCEIIKDRLSLRMINGWPYEASIGADHPEKRLLGINGEWWWVKEKPAMHPDYHISIFAPSSSINSIQMIPSLAPLINRETCQNLNKSTISIDTCWTNICLPGCQGWIRWEHLDKLNHFKRSANCDLNWDFNCIPDYYSLILIWKWISIPKLFIRGPKLNGGWKRRRSKNCSIVNRAEFIRRRS